MATPPLAVAPAPGRMNVDFEERVDFSRLREYRLRRAMGAIVASDLRALLVFDNNNIRYLPAVRIAEQHRLTLGRAGVANRHGVHGPWAFGFAADHHRQCR